MIGNTAIEEQKIRDCVEKQYDISVKYLEFLPIGNDINTAVYKVTKGNDKMLFLKLRKGKLFEPSVVIPKLLSDGGTNHVIVPLATKDSHLWVQLDMFILTLYPYIEGNNAFETAMSPDHWNELGKVLKNIHSLIVPEELHEKIPQETYSPQWRDEVSLILERVKQERFEDPIAQQLAEFLQSKELVIRQLITTAEDRLVFLQKSHLELVLCHADIHAGNILIDPQQNMYVVDWDTLIFAPKERDLMFIGAGIGSVWDRADELELFYRGYGQEEVNLHAITYYRCERIIEDIVAYCDQIVQSKGSTEDREQGLKEITSQFLPNRVVEIALRQR